MFYSQFILAKKGPLGTIWIAAHLERKLRKNQVADTDIGVSVDSILFPEVPIALRLSSHLLLGVVRIYSKKVNYLFDDCSDALLKVKQAFRSAAVDLPPEQSKAPYHSITLPETFDLDDFELPDNEAFQGNFVDHHVSTREQITLQDTMDGVAFPTSQFGPDERFGDGDTSQIGLDLDEELFMDKGDAAGTSGILVGTDTGLQRSPGESSSLKVDEHNEGIPDPLLASSTAHFAIQAPSTPGLTEEPNLPSTKEEIQVSDDHMDEDQNPCELAAKEVSGTNSSPSRPSDLGGSESHLNGNFHDMSQQDDVQVKALKTESFEFISSGFVQPATSNEHIEASLAVNGQESRGNIDNPINLDNEGIKAANVQSEEGFNVEEVNMNGTVLPVTENAIVMEVEDAGLNKTDLNGNYHPLLDSGAEMVKSSASPAVVPMDTLTGCSEHHNSLLSCVNLNSDEISESNIDEKPSGFGVPFLQSCTSKVPSACDGVDNVLDTSILPTQEDRPSSIGMFGKEDANNIFEILTNVQVEPASQADHIAYEATCAADSSLGGQQESSIAEENHSEKETNLQSSDFPPPEVLLSMPNPTAGLSGNFLNDSTPGKEVLTAKSDATDENIISGRKRSFTESTITIQSLNSVESAGGAQSKGIAELIPDDNDLLSSILAGKRSTSFKMKPTPPVHDTVNVKRQRTAVRSAPQKRKVLVDDSTVLHGDTIRQQLTNTEDIRRVRKKAPCTNLEVWVLQKQFLEDDIFIEPLFTGMSLALGNEDFDLNGIRIIQDNEAQGASQADKPVKPTLDEETEGLRSLEPSIADISVRSTLDENTVAVDTLVPSIVADEELLECSGSLLATPSEKESIMLGSTLPKEVENVDYVVMKHNPQYDASKEKLVVEFDEERTPIGDVVPPVASVSEPILSVDCVPEIACDSTDDTKIDLVNKSSDVTMSMHIDDASNLLLVQRCVTHCFMGDAFTVEDVSGSGTREQVDVGVSKSVDLDEISDGKQMLDKSEGVDTDVVTGNFQDTCSLPIRDFSISDNIALEHRVCPTSDYVVEDCQPDGLALANKDETSFTGLEHDGSCLTSNNVDEHVKLDSAYSVEAYVSSQNTNLNQTEGLQHLEADQKIDMGSNPVSIEFTNTGNNVEFEPDAIEHDTDFLNVDDEDVAEDYESDMPDHEEKHTLDNSGWSTRTRAVANYLQGVFEKESDQAKKVIPLDSLLVGKSRKEASRMFFETLVLKTKDYVQVEQESTFSDIKIKPRGKLMKPGF